MYDELTKLSEILQPARFVAIVLPPQPSFDQVAAATAFADALRTVDKEVNIYCPEKPALEGSELLHEINSIKTEFGKQNLVISFAYQEASVDKVSYAISQDSKRFFLTVKPKQGAQPLDPATVEYSYAGTDCELIIIFGEHDLTNLRQLYFGYEDVYQNTPIVTINTHQPEIGSLHFSVTDYSSYSELMAVLLGGMQFELSQDAASNLYAGLLLTTQSFAASEVSAETFEVAAELLRRGARRPHMLNQLVSHVQVERSLASAIEIEPSEKQTATLEKQSKPPQKKRLK